MLCTVCTACSGRNVCNDYVRYVLYMTLCNVLRIQCVWERYGKHAACMYACSKQSFFCLSCR